MGDIKTISVKGMVCDRCKRVLTDAFNKIGLEVKGISLGSIALAGTSKPGAMEIIGQTLRKNGFELLYDRKSTIASEIKCIVEEVFSKNSEDNVHVKISKLLEEKFHKSYNSISTLFSSSEGITLEKYIIDKRLEKVKELLVYTDLSLTEIAFRVGFSSVQHLSNQFKTLTGFSPSHFREIKARKEHLSRKT